MRVLPARQDQKGTMSGTISKDSIHDVRQRTDIVQVISQYVQLKRSGTNHLGLCPFHQEKTPSFNVNGQRQFYHCFGCHESGDVFTFLMKMEGRMFNEVVEDLAARNGIQVQYERSMSQGAAKAAAERRSEHQAGVELNGRVARLFQEMLASPDGRVGREYLEQRGVKPALVESFRLGLAPASGQAIVHRLAREPSTLALAERLGIVSRRQNGEGYYDRFRNRLIFPVTSVSGEVLAFGGRLLSDDNGPKYLNSPESSLYRKGEALYGLEQAGPHIRRRGSAILVEGNFDVVQMHQHGFPNTVAPMGTALTERQVQLLRRLCPSVTVLFDGDDAGQTATVKAIPLLIAEGLEASVSTLPAPEDPDSFLKTRGSEALEALLSSAVPGIDFLIHHHRRLHGSSIPAKVKILERVAPIVARLTSQVARDLYMGRLSSELGVEAQVVLRAIRGAKREQLTAQVARNEQAASQAATEPMAALTETDRTALHILGILSDHPHLTARAQAARVDVLLTNEALRATYKAAMEMLEEHGKIDAAPLLNLAPPALRDSLARTIASGAFASDGDPTRALDDCLAQLERVGLERELLLIHSQMRNAEQKGDDELLRTLVVRKVELEREIHEKR